MQFSPHMINEFYSRILLKKSKSNRMLNFDNEVFYTFFDGKWCMLTENDLSDLLNYKTTPVHMRHLKGSSLIMYGVSTPRQAVSKERLHALSPCLFVFYTTSLRLQCNVEVAPSTRLLLRTFGCLIWRLRVRRLILPVTWWTRWFSYWERRFLAPRSLPSTLESQSPLCDFDHSVWEIFGFLKLKVWVGSHCCEV